MTGIEDAALLARLQALRNPSLKEDLKDDSSTQPLQSTTHTSPSAITLEDRFRNLRSPSNEHNKNNSSGPTVEEERRLVGLGQTCDSELDDISQNVAILEGEKRVSVSDVQKLDGLLQEAKSTILQYHTQSSTQVVDEGCTPGPKEEQALTHQRSKSEESELAAEYIQKVLDELKVTDWSGEDDAEEKEGENANVAGRITPEKNFKAGKADDSILDLPSVPSKPPAHEETKQDTDDDLLARLAALKDASGKNENISAKKGEEARWTSIAKDEDVTEWCVICCDDATIKCLGCDGDLYCRACWREGHNSEDAGMEERMHKAVLYQKPGKEKRTRKIAA
jgi:hypothetical protein